MKKIIAVLMVFVLLAACSVFAFADGDEEVITGSCYRFKILNDEEASIVGFFGDGGYLHLDSSIGHRYITSVGTSAFEFNTNLINIRLNSRVKEIGDYAFHGCTELQRITIPASVQSIGKYAFQSCNDLEKIRSGGGYRAEGRHLHVLPGPDLCQPAFLTGEDRHQSV